MICEIAGGYSLLMCALPIYYLMSQHILHPRAISMNLSSLWQLLPTQLNC